MVRDIIINTKICASVVVFLLLWATMRVQKLQLLFKYSYEQISKNHEGLATERWPGAEVGAAEPK